MSSPRHARSKSLRESAAAGARWTSLSTAITVCAQFGQLAVLARLLTPAEFGLAASAIVIIGFAGRLADAGVNNAIIAKQTTDRNVLSSLYWANVTVGVGTALLVVGSIPLATSYFDEPGLGGLLALAAPASLVAPLGQQFQAVLERELQFQPLARIEATAFVLGACAAVLLASLGVGAASVVGGYLVQTSTKALWLAVRGWSKTRPQRRFRRSDLRGYLSFGLYQMGERATNYLGSNLDYALIGGFLGSAALGVYSVAFRLVTLPQMRLNPILTRVAFPVFAKRQDDDAALCRGYLEVTRLIAFVSFPVMGVLAATAPHLVPVAFGSQWEKSIPLLQVLAIAGVFFSLSNLNGSIFLAKSRPDLGLKLNVGRLVTLAAAFAVALQGGVLAVAWAFVGVAAVMFIVTRLILGKLIGLSMSSYLGALAPAGLATAAMVVAIISVDTSFGDALDTDFQMLCAQLAAGGCAYALGTALVARAWAADTWRLLVGRGAPTPATGA